MARENLAPLTVANRLCSSQGHNIVDQALIFFAANVEKCRRKGLHNFRKNIILSCFLAIHIALSTSQNFFVMRSVVFYSFILLLSSSCKKDKESSAYNNKPTVSTITVSAITTTGAKVAGTVTGDGGAGVTQRGIIWSKFPNPGPELLTLTSDGQGTGNFNSSLSDLTPATTYYVRAYAKNIHGTGLGNEMSFSTNAAVPPYVSNWTMTSVSPSTLPNMNFVADPERDLHTYYTMSGTSADLWADGDDGTNLKTASVHFTFSDKPTSPGIYQITQNASLLDGTHCLFSCNATHNVYGTFDAYYANSSGQLNVTMNGDKLIISASSINVTGFWSSFGFDVFSYTIAGTFVEE
jgi:hypothetical protein